MSLAHLLCDEGVCGRRLLGALLDAGAPLEAVREPVDRIGLGVRLEAPRAEVRTVTATRVEVTAGTGAEPLRSPAELRDAIEAAKLGHRAGGRARRMADALADAEAAMHGIDIDEVRFHELSRPRTVVVLVAVAAALEELGVERVTTSPVALGGGTVEIAHGRFGVPPPAVAHLLAGFDVHGGPVDGELTTPSGAAALAALAEPVAAIPAMRLTSHGRGAVGEGPDARALVVLLGTP